MDINQYKKNNLPSEPGVYLFKKNREILYIGKATSLKDRAKSYFSSDLIATRGPLIVDMVFQSDDIEFIKTDSVLEALILESNLIKKHQPRYNTKEKDDKSYNYVVITKEYFPKVLIERGRNLSNGGHSDILQNVRMSKVYGPFTNGTQLKEALKIIRKIFPFLDKYSKEGASYGFYKEIGLVPDVSNNEARKDYLKNIRNIKLFFEGKKKNIIKNLEKEMKLLAKKHEFEKADKIKRTIFALNHIQDVSLIKNEGGQGLSFSRFAPQEKILSAIVRIEGYDIAHISGTNTVGVMTVVENGIASKSEYRKFKIGKYSRTMPSGDVASLEEVLRRRFTHEEWRFPDVIVVDGSTAQKNIAEKIIKELGLKIAVVAVTKDERHRPKMIQGREDIVSKYKSEILLANSEAHRFAIKYHRELRGKII